jgi:MAP/microtubule affinity-regulating kinase
MTFDLLLISSPQHTSHTDGRNEVTTRPVRSGARCRNSIASCADEQPHIGNYRLLKTIGKGNFAKVKLARHILTGREVRQQQEHFLICLARVE